jgi:O-antigen/teichoic acid export membrane protein
LAAADILKRGLKFTAAGQMMTNGIRFASNLILTRLLAPEYFGVMAIAMLVSYAAAMLCDVGLRSAIITEKRAEERRFRDTVWSLMTIRALVYVTLLFGFSLVIDYLVAQGLLSPTSTYADPRLKVALMLTAAAGSIAMMESVEVLYHERQMHFGTILRIDLIRQVLNTAITITWAWLAPSIVALLAGSIIANLCVTTGTYVWLAKRGPRFIWSLSVAMSLMERAKWLWVSAILTFSMNIFDRLFLARHFDAKLIGLHSIALLYSTIVIDLVTKFNYSVVYPMLSKARHDGETELWKAYYTALQVIVKIALPAGFFFLTFGDKLIELLYDSRYNDAGPLLRTLGYIAFLAVYLPAAEVHEALGHAKLKSIIFMLRLTTLVAALMTFIPATGLMGGIYALIGSQLVGALASLHYNRKHGLFRLRKELELLGAIALLVLLSYGVRAILF